MHRTHSSLVWFGARKRGISTQEKKTCARPLNKLRIDGPEKMNTISGEFRQEIEDIWSGQIADDPSVKAVVFISGKPDNYIAGADIRMISSTKNKADLKKVRSAPPNCKPGLQICYMCALFRKLWFWYSIGLLGGGMGDDTRLYP